MASAGLTILLFIGILLFLVAIGVPIAISIGLTSIAMMLMPFGPDFSLGIISNQLFHGVNSFVFLAFPFYLLLGRLMNRIGLTDQIFDFASALVGQFRGGLAFVNIVASIIFAGMSGLVTADVAGIGRIEYYAMRARDYPKDMSLGVTAASAVVGPIMPPSVQMIIYAVLAQVSIGAMFLGGVLPALMIGLSIAIFVYTMILRSDNPDQFRSEDSFSIQEVVTTFLQALPALILPALIIGGIVFGWYTATEAGAFAVILAIIVGFVYGDLTTVGLVQELRDSMVETFAITFIIANAALYSHVAVSLRIPILLVDSLVGLTTHELSLMFLLVLVFFVVGTFMDKISAIALLVPVLAPTIDLLEIDPIYFGVVMVVSLMVGALTPPVGGAIIALEKVTDATMKEIIYAVIPYMVPLVVVVILIVLFPSLITYIPYTLMG